MKEMQEEGREEGRDGARDWSLGTKVMEEKGRRRKRENESKRNGRLEGSPLKGNTANVHKRCSWWLQLRTYSVRTTRAGQYRCLNNNANHHTTYIH